MAATFEFDEDNGVATGSPARGTTAGTTATQVNWKNTDDVATVYSTSPITAGNNSFTKYQFGKFSGVWNSISAGLFAHTAGSFGTGIALKTNLTSTYATPAVTANAALTTDVTATTAIASGIVVLFNTTPAAASPTASFASTTSNPAFTQYLPTQLQTTVAASAGDTTTVTLTLQYNEN